MTSTLRTRLGTAAGLLVDFLALLFIAMVLTACGSLVTTEVVRAEVAVPILCRVTLPPEPRWDLDAPDLQPTPGESDAEALARQFKRTARALAEIESRIAYEAQLKAALAACQ